ncbi:hypothetical protein GCM10010448_07340 [Streptomyces glomeratus]|uniref:PPM-type phosphatase domain-containing protein n=1 Tax=Streptomyces glomeratus TaxID=284452 RepID=A0ABP6L2H5_9ACTN
MPGIGVPSRLSALRSTAARIGTTLDEDTTCAELVREVAGQVGGAAAVLRGGREFRSRYEAVAGNPAVLPDPWSTAAAAQEAAGPRESAVPFPVAGYPGLALCVPLAANGHSYGVLVSARQGTPFTHEETEVLTFLAEHAASHIRHAREHDAVSGIVGKLQRALLSAPGRPHPNLDVAVRYLPVGQSALIGGDWCETVRLHFGRTMLVVGDVMGHGLEAAVDMTAYRSSLRYKQVDPNRSQVTITSAGHLPPVVIDEQGRASLLPIPVGPPLGTGLGGYEPATYRLDPSQTLVLFTDGLVERRGEDIEQSLRRLAGVGFEAASGVEDVLDTVLARLDARHAEDDVAVLAARLHHRSAQAHDTRT